MRLLLSIFLFSIGLSVSASPGQPYFVKETSTSSNTHTNWPTDWWTFIDFAAGEVVTNWIARVSGATMSQQDPTRQPTNQSGGVYFHSAQILTNATQISRGNDTDNLVTLYFAIKRAEIPTSASQVIVNDIFDGGYGYQGFAIEADMFWEIQGLSHWEVGFVPTNGSVYDIVLIPNSSSEVYAYTNGVLATKMANPEATHFAAFGADGAYEPPMRWWLGSIQQIAIWTNAPAVYTAQFIANTVSNLHYYTSHPLETNCITP